MTPIPSQALVDTLNLFKRDWDSDVCPVCRKCKWGNSPFCRSCSIKIQRIRMMRGFQTWIGFPLSHNFNFFKRQERNGYKKAVYAWLTWYDRCRDYLGTRRRFGIQTFRDSAVPR